MIDSHFRVSIYAINQEPGHIWIHKHRTTIKHYHVLFSETPNHANITGPKRV
ncbi:hypothetical protein Hdeb2414_s0970g00969691 [Helianthus debilis subsp. tardiflorus]